MICIIALVVFSILGLFSATHRKTAYEAFDCVFRKMTLRKCHTGLDQRLKGELVGRVMKFSPKIASILFKYFSIFSWTFVIISMISTGYVVYGGYNFYMYGNCNGPQDDSFCIFDPSGSNTGYSDLGATCGDERIEGNLKYPDLDGYLLPTLRAKSPKVKVIQFGCYICEYTRSANKDVLKLLNRDDIEFTYVNVMIPNHNLSRESAIVAECVRQQSEKTFWNYHFKVFEDEFSSKTNLMDLAVISGADLETLNNCVNSEEVLNIVEKNSALGQEVGIYGTPTYFIGNKTVVGPKPYRVLARLIRNEK